MFRCTFVAAIIALSASAAFGQMSDGTYAISARNDLDRFIAQHVMKPDIPALHLNDSPNNDQLLSTRYPPRDWYSQFQVERQGDGTIRIRGRASGRWLHANDGGDHLVSSRFQPQDAYTRFFVDAVPGLRNHNSYSAGLLGIKVRLGGYVARLRVQASGRYLSLRADGVMQTTDDVNEAAELVFSAVAGCNAEAVNWDGTWRTSLAIGKPVRHGSHSPVDAALAVDGSICTGRTEAGNGTEIPWWEVDLGQPMQVDAIFVWRGRQTMGDAIVATAAEPLGDSIMTVGEGVNRYKLDNNRLNIVRPTWGTQRASVSNPLGGSSLHFHTPTPPDPVRYIRIYIPARQGTVSLDEVMVIGNAANP
ncbi:MAG: hypothetical protein KC620_17790 [Myxococcales bacterium]|nr:hypothetical protein [Myxococcales bacterium]